MQESVLTWHGVVGFMYTGRDPAQGSAVAQGSPAAKGSPGAQKSHGGLRLGARSHMLWQKHHQREEMPARAALRETAWPLMDARRCDGRHIKRGRRDGPGSRWGEWYLSKFEVGCAKPHVMAKTRTRS